MNIELNDQDASRLMALLRKRNEVRANLLDAMRQDAADAIALWADELKGLNQQAGSLLFRNVEYIA